MIVPNSELAPRKGPPLAATVMLWAFVTMAMTTITALGQSVKGSNVDLLERLIWEIGWMGWAPLTYSVLWICRRHPIDRQRRVPSVARLALFGVGVVMLQMAFDFTCNTVLGMLLRNTPFTLRHLLYIAVFKAHIYYGVYWMIVGAAHAYEFHRRYRESELVSSQLETKLANAELTRLKSQLQPHFLFNAHNAIVGLMLKQDNDAAIRMLTRLSDLLRISLSRANQQLVSLHDELETLRLYLDIQRERFRDRLSITLNIPAELEEAEVPHLILQPLVENALQHGLQDVTEEGKLEIRAWRVADTLAIAVIDNGCGFEPCHPPLHVQTAPTVGIGLANTRERLNQLYGRNQSFAIESALEQGTTITLRIPYRARMTMQTAAL